MTEQEKRNWLQYRADVIYNTKEPYADTEYPTANIMYVACRKSSKIDRYIEAHHGKWIRQGTIQDTFQLPNGLTYHVVYTSDNARGYRPRRAIIDSDINIEDLETLIFPKCICCHEMEII